jgi:starvation-inducible DNA-binding protein
MADNNLEKILQVYLADLFVVYMKVYKYHWNVKGEGFLSVHSFYNDVFESLSEIIDATAERMRQLNFYAPCSAMEFCSLTTIKEEQGFSKSVDDTLVDVVADLTSLGTSLQSLYKVLDEGSLGLFTTHDLILSKHQWFANSMVD